MSGSNLPAPAVRKLRLRDASALGQIAPPTMAGAKNKDDKTVITFSGKT
jgi:hypothetical protein